MTVSHCCKDCGNLKRYEPRQWQHLTASEHHVTQFDFIYPQLMRELGDRSSDHCFAISIAWQLFVLKSQYLPFKASYCSDILWQLSHNYFFIILYGDVTIPCCHDVTVGCYALDFLFSSIFRQFFALKRYVSSCICWKVFKKASSNVLKSSLVLTVKLIWPKYM